MSAFERLSEAFQYQVVHTLGFKSLRPVQTQTIDTVLDGKNCVVLAPTAGGKTEAAFFPLLSSMDAEDWRPVSVIYLSPIRALLNNQEARLERYASVIGRRVFKWHGDVTPAKKKRFIKEPADILLTTPESLEAMLMSARVPTAQLFAGLRAVVIDEIHAFAGDDRGAHLVAVLERLQRLAGVDYQRIGLSATVGNPETILGWTRGSSAREGLVVRPGGAHKVPQIAVDFVGGLENAAQVIAALHPGKKRLVFTDSRRAAEDLGKQLAAREVLTYVTHGSLSAAERRDAERAFAEGTNCVIVATSALELGIDVGDLDHVLQIDCPSKVASFLQRMGRTGRRDDAVPNCTFLATKETALLETAALLHLHGQGWVESVQPSRRAFHVLAHQAMALGIQLSGAGADWYRWIDGATCFADIAAHERAALIANMHERTILADHDGKLWLGPEGEKTYGRANFRELYAVFDAPRQMTVQWNRHEIGTVEATFLMSIHRDDAPACFTLAGKTWEARNIDWQKGTVLVRPAPEGRAPRWMGSPRPLSYEMAQAMRHVLVTDDVPTTWSKRAREAMASTRGEYTFLRDEESDMSSSASEILWWNFAGGAANALLAALLRVELGDDVVGSNTRIALRKKAGQSLSAFTGVLARLRAQGGPTDAEVEAAAAGVVRGRLSKFEPCLTSAQMVELVVARVFDRAGVVRVLAQDNSPAARIEPIYSSPALLKPIQA